MTNDQNDDQTFKFLVRYRSSIAGVVLLALLATYYCFQSAGLSEVKAAMLITTYGREPTLSERIDDLTIGIASVEKATFHISEYTCKSKHKCKSVDYSKALLYLQVAAGTIIRARYGQYDKCREVYAGGFEYCEQYSEDLHSAIHIVEDLIRTLTRRKNGSWYVSSQENKIIVKFLGQLTAHQDNMKNFLKCLKDTSVEDKTRCDSRRPPKY